MLDLKKMHENDKGKLVYSRFAREIRCFILKNWISLEIGDFVDVEALGGNIVTLPVERFTLFRREIE